MNAATLALASKLLRGDRQALARAITLVESSNENHRLQAEALLEHVASVPRSLASGSSLGSGPDSGAVALAAPSPLPRPRASGPPLRVGIAGPPGAGKSTLIEALGRMLTAQGLRVAVLTIDPSSHVTGGSILGDKSRMHELSRDPMAYVRPSPSRGVLGGLTRYTTDCVRLCEAGGYDVVVVETVGLGQSEVKVDDAVDVVALVLPPAGGDELQGAKKGIMEVADLVVVNKADGALKPAALATRQQYRLAMQLARPKHAPTGDSDHAGKGAGERPEEEGEGACERGGWSAPVLCVSAATGDGIKGLWEQVVACRRYLEGSGQLLERRRRQAEVAMWEELKAQVVSVVERDSSLRSHAASEAQALAAGAFFDLNGGACAKGSAVGLGHAQSDQAGDKACDAALPPGVSSGRLSSADLLRTFSGASSGASSGSSSGSSPHMTGTTRGTTPRAAAARLLRAISARLSTRTLAAAPSSLDK